MPKCPKSKIFTKHQNCVLLGKVILCKFLPSKRLNFNKISVLKTSKSVKVTVFQPSHSSKLISPKTRFKILLKSLTTRLVCKDLNESLWIHDSPLSLCESVGVYMCPFLGFWVLWVFLSISETFLSLCKSFWVSVSLFDFWVSVSFFWVSVSLFESL